MHSTQLENFAREHPGRASPWFRTLEASEAGELLARLAARLGTVGNGQEVVRAIFQRARLRANVEADDDAFELARVFESVPIQPTARVFVNWYHFDQIDEMEFRELNRFFTDIWYPAADDIDIVDETLSWIVSIGHEGDVRVLVPE